MANTEIAMEEGILWRGGLERHQGQVVQVRVMSKEDIDKKWNWKNGQKQGYMAMETFKFHSNHDGNHWKFWTGNDLI